MDSLFGLSMDAIMIALVVMLGVCLSTIAFIFLRNRIMFLMGLRNIPRRLAQTVLIIVGLMLSTIIITAAFTTGDTVDHSITQQAYTLLGHIDQVVDPETQTSVPSTAQQAAAGKDIPGDEYRAFVSALDRAQLPGVDGYMGVLFEPVPVVNPGARLSEPNVTLTGIDAARAAAFPDIVDKDSGAVLSVDGLAPGEAYMNASAAEQLGARAGDVVQVYVQNEPHDYKVRAIVEDRVITGANSSEEREGMVASLDELQTLFGHDRVDLVAVSDTGGVNDTLALNDQVEASLKALIKQNNFNLTLGDGKADAVDLAQQFGNVMTTFFLLLGLFSIGAGMLLIVMIFVMLAAERKSEMGMARAVGTKRWHLMEMFVAEGTGYNLASAAVGVGLGILVAFALAMAASAIFSTFGISFQPYVTGRTAVISYSLGVVLTFVTVSFSSWRISNLNIVRAIRDIPEPTNKRMGWRGLLTWALLMALGGLLFFVGVSAGEAFPFAFGFSLVLAGLAVLLTHFGLPARPAYTAMGLGLLVFWGFTAGQRFSSIFGDLHGGIEMFFLSGVAMVTASTFVLIYNSDVFLAGLSRVGGLFGSILPSLRTAIAYPMNNRFRTGMTLAMISLVVFALTMMSAMNLNYDRLFLNDESRGGWDVQVVENPNNPIPNVAAALGQQSSPAAAAIKAEGAVLLAGGQNKTEVRQGDGGWGEYMVRGLTPGFIDGGSVPLGNRARGYESDRAVWDALKTDPNVAVIDGFTIRHGFGPNEFSLRGVGESDKTFDAVSVTVRDKVSGRTHEVNIIGIIAFGSSANFTGVFVPQQTFLDTFGTPQLSIHYVALEDPGRSGDVAREMESALLSAGVQAKSLKDLADERNALSRNFLHLMQAFMGLGLIVGIAAIGVIAFRTVVERRQQIGMLRAIGYKRSQVSLSLLLESSFVTVLGVLAGIGLSLWLSYFLVTSKSFPGDGDHYYIPWLEMGVIAAFTVVASLLMTLIPARQAASIPTAEALRYE